ncbi:hypothetical protein [Leptospira idonii]|uniref:Uncharacterized protein n=1 Tax=Leptospira idonii TaxID=1193500 RepID=A0A4R9LUZ6_9LEPT|nr:hypothetical protein [Leptospira idonii]TGN17901.1 hypothetical protein EHS15_15895 [Leptospira idonii]
MPVLEIQLKIPIEVDHLVGAPALTFSHWLPIGKENGINAIKEEMEINLWFEIESTWWASRPTKEDIPKRVNVLAHYINATIIINNLPKDFVQFIESQSLPNPKENPSDERYERMETLGSKIIINTINLYNRLISYIRNNKGQYWLRNFELNLNLISQVYIRTQAKAKIDNSNWFRFQPNRKNVIKVTTPDQKAYIKEDEWNNIKNFVLSDQKTSLVGELFSTAQQLAGNGYLRNSIIDAVTALEIVISEFKNSDKANALLAKKFNERLNTKNLKNQIEHCGFSATIGYLLPLLLEENELPTELIRQCQNAIMLRQNIIHNGQRNVEEASVNQHIANIKTICNILRVYI